MMPWLNLLSNKLVAPFKGVISWALPPSCIVCDALVEGKGVGVCPSCWSNLPRWDKDYKPVPFLSSEIDSFNAPMLYESSIMYLVRSFKYSDQPEFAKLLAGFMVEVIPDIDMPLIVPVPMYGRRLWLRQFNQSALLAKELALHTGYKLDMLSFKRIKHTSAQAGKSAVARKQNLAGAFAVIGNNIKNRNIVLVDDVWTTGSTANICAKVLKKAGAKTVHVITLAYVAK